MNWRQYILLVAILCCVPMLAQQKAPAKKEKPFTVVIDAGHGGHDPGALGKITQEKKLNLDVSLLLGRMIEEEYPDVRVCFTRKTDVFLTLQERANFVNKNNADLFICIHTNASESREAVGAETFVLGIDKMASNLSVAMRENSVMLLEDNYETTYQGFDPNSIESYIMFELMQDRYFDQSLQFATQVQQEFAGTLNRADRGVRQAGFWVLHKSACPSVLVEMGFISNATEEKYLVSQTGKEELGAAIFTAFANYKAALDRRRGIEPRIVGRPQAMPRPQAATTDSLKQAPLTECTPAKEEAVQEPERPVFRIQICTTTTELKNNDPTFKGLKNCRYTRDGKYYKYTYGESTDYHTIADLQKKVREKFKDCFIVAFLGEKQITVKEARALAK